MRQIYLSPHLDDAVLSCGGIIFEQRKAGIDVQIWNWMSRIPPADLHLSPLARSVHAGWRLDSVIEVYAVRRAEDRQAASRVDAQIRNFDFLDCIYRQSAEGTPLYTEELFVPPHHADDALVDEIAALIMENLNMDDVLISPLGIGKHPDHAIVRRAAEQTGHPLRYYADIPYTLRHPDQFTALTAGMEVKTLPVSEESLQVWQDAIAAYALQISTLFLTEEMMKNAIKSYWQAQQGIIFFVQP